MGKFRAKVAEVREGVQLIGSAWKSGKRINT